MGRDRPPLVVVAVGSLDATDDEAARLRAGGWTVIDRLTDLPVDLRRVVCRAVVRDEETAAQAVLAAAWGAGVVLAAGEAPPLVRARLVDDLARIGRVRRVADAASSRRVSSDAAAILDLVADGHTLGEAARRLNLSRRTADRRLAEARVALGVRSTTAAVAAWRLHRAVD